MVGEPILFYNKTMQFFKDKDSSDFKVQAMIIASQKVVELMGKDIAGHCFRHKVSLVNVAPAQFYGPDAISLVLEGKQNDIKNSLSQLRKICYQKEIGIESNPVKSIPPVLQGYLFDMENDIRFEKIFSYCSKEYLEYCKQNNIIPHPEVLETLTL